MDLFGSSVVKNPPANAGVTGSTLGQEDPLEKKMATEFSIFPVKSHRQKSLLGYTSWEIDGETVETVSDFIFLVSKITTDGDCSHEIKRRLLLGRKVMTTYAMTR